MVDIDSLTGRDLDAAVAEKVMGYTPCPHWHRATAEGGRARTDHYKEEDCEEPTYDPYVWPQSCPHYSTEIEDAWEVLLHLNDNGWDVTVGPMSNGRGGCVISPAGNPMNMVVHEHADSAEIAICRAALKVVDMKVG